MIDLHLHSTASDGSFAPEELIDLAAQRGLAMVALTDHDTVAGVPAFLEAAAGHDALYAIGGVEISAVHEDYHVHLLGYGVSKDNPSLDAALVDYRRERDRRGDAIVGRLQGLGIDITVKEAHGKAGGEAFGRPHIAEVLIEKGYVRDTGEAFREYLASGAKAYVERERPTALEAVARLRKEKVVPVLAHPPIMKMPDDALDRFVGELREAGLMGIETFYPSYSHADVEVCVKLAARYGLLRTGGTDFHGASKPDIDIGVGAGHLRVPEPLGDRLREAIADLQGDVPR